MLLITSYLNYFQKIAKRILSYETNRPEVDATFLVDRSVGAWSIPKPTILKGPHP